MSDYTITTAAEVPDVLADYPGEMRMLTGALDSEQVAFMVRRCRRRRAAPTHARTPSNTRVSGRRRAARRARAAVRLRLRLAGRRSRRRARRAARLPTRVGRGDGQQHRPAGLQALPAALRRQPPARTRRVHGSHRERRVRGQRRCPARQRSDAPRAGPARAQLRPHRSDGRDRGRERDGLGVRGVARRPRSAAHGARSRGSGPKPGLPRRCPCRLRRPGSPATRRLRALIGPRGPARLGPAAHRRRAIARRSPRRWSIARCRWTSRYRTTPARA